MQTMRISHVKVVIPILKVIKEHKCTTLLPSAKNYITNSPTPSYIHAGQHYTYVNDGGHHMFLVPEEELGRRRKIDDPCERGIHVEPQHVTTKTCHVNNYHAVCT